MRESGNDSQIDCSPWKQWKVDLRKGRLATIWQHLIKLIELHRITGKGLTDFLKSVGPFHIACYHKGVCQRVISSYPERYCPSPRQKKHAPRSWSCHPADGCTASYHILPCWFHRRDTFPSPEPRHRPFDWSALHHALFGDQYGKAPLPLWFQLSVRTGLPMQKGMHQSQIWKLVLPMTGSNERKYICSRGTLSGKSCSMQLCIKTTHHAIPSRSVSRPVLLYRVLW